MKTFALNTRIARCILASVTIVTFACLSGLAFAGGDSKDGSGVFVPELGIRVPSAKAAALQHSLANSIAGSTRSAAVSTESAQRAPAAVEKTHEPTATADPIPAKLLGSDVPVPISPVILNTTNGWLVSDGSTLVAVYAGAAGDNPAQGRLAIVRQDLQEGTQTVDIVDAGETGALTIIDPPLGAAVETSAQRGTLLVRGAHGAKRALRLSTDKIEIPQN